MVGWIILFTFSIFGTAFGVGCLVFITSEQNKRKRRMEKRCSYFQYEDENQFIRAWRDDID